MPLTFQDFVTAAGERAIALQVRQTDGSHPNITISPQMLNNLTVSVLNDVDTASTEVHNATQAALLAVISMDYDQTIADSVRERFFKTTSSTAEAATAADRPLTGKTVRGIDRFIRAKQALDAIPMNGTIQKAVDAMMKRPLPAYLSLLRELPAYLTSIDRGKALDLIRHLVKSEDQRLMKTHSTIEMRDGKMQIALALIKCMRKLGGQGELQDQFRQSVAENGKSYLYYGVLSGKADIVRSVLDAGVHPDCKLDNHGKTALHVAARRPDTIEIALLLLERGASLNARCSSAYGKPSTPLDIAFEKKRHDTYVALIAFAPAEERAKHFTYLAEHNARSLLEKCHEKDALREDMAKSLDNMLKARHWDSVAPLVEVMGAKGLLSLKDAERVTFITTMAKKENTAVLHQCAKEDELSDVFQKAFTDAANKKQWNLLVPLVRADQKQRLLGLDKQVRTAFLTHVAHVNAKEGPLIMLGKCSRDGELKKELIALLKGAVNAGNFGFANLLQILEPEDWMPAAPHELLDKLYKVPNLLQWLFGATAQPWQNRHAFINEIGSYYIQQLTIKKDQRNNLVEASAIPCWSHFAALLTLSPDDMARIAAAIVLASVQDYNLDLEKREYAPLNNLFGPGIDNNLNPKNTLQYIKKLDKDIQKYDVNAVRMLAKEGSAEWSRIPAGTRQMIGYLKAKQNNPEITDT